MANYIYTVLMSKVMVVLSWGLIAPSPSLMVCASRYRVSNLQALLRLSTMQADLFNVHLSNGTVVADVYVDSLVEVIDGLVERTNDYEERVKKEYGLINR